MAAKVGTAVEEATVSDGGGATEAVAAAAEMALGGAAAGRPRARRERVERAAPTVVECAHTRAGVAREALAYLSKTPAAHALRPSVAARARGPWCATGNT